MVRNISFLFEKVIYSTSSFGIIDSSINLVGVWNSKKLENQPGDTN